MMNKEEKKVVSALMDKINHEPHDKLKKALEWFNAEKTDHQKVGTFYRSIIRAYKKEEKQCKYFHKHKPDTNTKNESYMKSQAKVNVLSGLIISLEKEFGFITGKGRYFDNKKCRNLL